MQQRKAQLEVRQRLHRRRGSLMVEMVVCTVLLTAVTAILVPGIHAVHQQRKLMRYDAHTVIELNNLAALSSAEKPQDLKLSTWFTDRYSGVTLSVEAVEAKDEAELPAAIFTITRSTQEGRPDIRRSLTVWQSIDNTISEEDTE